MTDEAPGSGVATGPDHHASGEAYLGRLRQDMVRGSLWTAVASIASLPTGLLVNIIVARTLGASQFGRFAALAAAYGLLSGLLNLGWSNATIQFLAAARATGDRAAETDVVRRCAGYHTFIEGPLLALLTAIYLRHESVGAVVSASVAVLMIQVIGTSTVILTATARNALSARLAFLVTVTSQATIVTLATSTHSGTLTWTGQVCAALMSPILAFVFVGRDYRAMVMRPKLGRGNAPGFFSYAISSAGAGVITGLALGRSELFVLRGDHQLIAAGVFTLATSLGGQVTLPMDSLMAPLIPTAAALFAVSRDLAVERMLKAIRVTALLGALTSAAMVPVVCVLIPKVYGTSFESAVGPAALLGVVSCIQSIILPIDAFVLAARSAGAVFKANSVCLAVDVVLAFGLIPRLGLAGAVIANAATQILSLIFLVRIAERRLDVRLVQLARAARIFAIGPVSAAVSLIPLAVGLSFVPRLVAALLVGPVILIVSLRAVPGLRLRDDDVASIRFGLPRKLTLVLDLILRVGGITASPAEADVGRAGQAPQSPSVPGD